MGQNKRSKSIPILSTRTVFNTKIGVCGYLMPHNNEPDEDTTFASSYLKSKKACNYAPINVIDGNPKTAWIEGEKGYGVGSEIIIPKLLTTKRPVKIWIGYGKSRRLYQKNSRPKKIEVAIIRSKIGYPDPHDAIGGDGTDYRSLEVVAKHKITLKDVNGYQNLPLPPYTTEIYHDFPPDYHGMDWHDLNEYKKAVEKGTRKPYKQIKQTYKYFLKIKILRIYEGTKYKDTAISEILF